MDLLFNLSTQCRLLLLPVWKKRLVKHITNVPYQPHCNDSYQVPLLMCYFHDICYCCLSNQAYLPSMDELYRLKYSQRQNRARMHRYCDSVHHCRLFNCNSGYRTGYEFRIIILRYCHLLVHSSSIYLESSLVHSNLKGPMHGRSITRSHRLALPS